LDPVRTQTWQLRKRLKHNLHKRTEATQQRRRHSSQHTANQHTASPLRQPLCPHMGNPRMVPLEAINRLKRRTQVLKLELEE